MLILTRHTREVVMVGADIQIMVVDVKGDRVHLGITAPRELKILRQELRDDPDSRVGNASAPAPAPR